MTTRAKHPDLRTISQVEPRERLLKAAEEAFAAQGFHGASLNAIARSVGLSNPGLIHHYPTKAALYLAVLDRIAEEFAADLDSVLAPFAEQSQRLHALILAQSEWAVRRPQALRLVLRELIDNIGRVESADFLPLIGIVKKISNELAFAQRAGLLPDGPPLAFATQLLGAMSYAVVVRPTFHRMHPGEHFLDSDKSWVEAVARSLCATLQLDERPPA